MKDKKEKPFEAGKQVKWQEQNQIQQINNNISVLNNKQKYTLLQKDVFELFVKEHEVVEFRILKVWGESPAWKNDFAKGTVSGYFDNFDDFKKFVDRAMLYQQNNIYFTLQVIDPRLIGRAYNKLKPTDLTTSDNNVLYYRWIPIDIDPKRPSGVSSSVSELNKEIELRDIRSIDSKKQGGVNGKY